VGPVHAGIIEPGHFRFQAMGEDVINLEERLGYVHKGIEKKFESFSWNDAFRLAGRFRETLRLLTVWPTRGHWRP